MKTCELIEFLRNADGAIQKCFPSVEGGESIAQYAIDKIEELEAENDELKKMASMASIFVDDVMPQISKLCIQDFGNLNELCMALSASKK